MIFDLIKFIIVRTFRKNREAEQTHISGLPPQPYYDPSCFDVTDLDSAKAIILTPEGSSTEERWQNETPLVVENIIKECGLTNRNVILDFGCGVGRIARELIDNTGAFIIGVDISSSMCRLALDYVASDSQFVCVSPSALDVLIDSGLRVDAAYSVWVLQHCSEPEIEITRILSALKPGGKLHVVNNLYRAVPTSAGWADDSKNIRSLLSDLFEETSYFHFQEESILQAVRQFTYCATYEKTRSSEKISKI
jgi:ubiquinone/menaquinone biosynthesis C-methylase UbiE